MTLLYDASYFGHAHLVRFLLQQKGNPDLSVKFQAGSSSLFLYVCAFCARAFVCVCVCGCFFFSGSGGWLATGRLALLFGFLLMPGVGWASGCC